MKKKRFLFIAPHLDDAVLSCGGFIGKLTKYNYPVTILTIFSGDPKWALSDFAKVVHAEWGLPEEGVSHRRTEDINALYYLGAEYIHEDYLDCIYRKDTEGNFLYQSFDDIVKQSEDREIRLIEYVRRTIDGYLQKNRWDIVSSPLAIGRHVDHRIVRRAIQLVQDDLSKIVFHFYEDLPYAAANSIEVLPNKKYMSFIEDCGEQKMNAIKFYKSQIKSDAQVYGIDTEPIIGYGKKLGAAAGKKFGERYWYKCPGGH